jgi:hypothetical protein
MLNGKIWATAACAAMLMALSAGAEEGVPSGPMTNQVFKAAEGMPGEAHDVLMERGEFWLGVMVSRPAPAMQAQLKLPKDQGLLVESVQPKSPAAKAGIQQYDVLLKANDKPLGDLRDLMKLIKQVKEGKLTLELLRGGKHETVVATLAKRPADELDKGLSPDARAWIEKFGPKMSEGQPLRFHVFGPGQIVPPGDPEAAAPGTATTKVEVTVHTKVNLADGSKVEITREGDRPAKVIVTRDKERWEGTSEDLSKIPEKIRPEVERLLRSPMDHIRFFTSPAGPAQVNAMYFGGAGGGYSGGVPLVTMPGTIAIGGPEAARRLSEMQKQIDELRKQVDALQGNAKPK